MIYPEIRNIATHYLPKYRRFKVFQTFTPGFPSPTGTMVSLMYLAKYS